MKYQLALLFCGLFFLNFSHQEEKGLTHGFTTRSRPMQQPFFLSKKKFYRYIDGNNNVWNISKKSIAYKPISKEISSSGTYSGGQSFQTKITADQYHTIRALLQKGLANTAIHLQDRQMGSGAIVALINENTKTATCYLPMHAVEKAAIEDWLNQFKK